MLQLKRVIIEPDLALAIHIPIDYSFLPAILMIELIMKQEKKSFFLLGDSISIHYRPFLIHHLGSSWTIFGKDGTARDLEDLDFPRGANGGDSAMVLEYLKNELPFSQTKTLLLNCGLHDIKRYESQSGYQVTTDEYKKNLTAITKLCKDSGMTLIWITTTGFDEIRHNTLQKEFKRHEADGELFNSIALDVMHQAELPVIDLRRFTASLEGDEIFDDHIHFSLPVRRRQGEFLSLEVRKILDGISD